MKNKIFTVSILLAALLNDFTLSSPGSDGTKDNNVRVLASGPNFAIHQFEGSVIQWPRIWSTCPGIVLSHTDLKTGEMKWLLSTGIYEINTRRPSFSKTRLVGLVQDSNHLMVLLYVSSEIFTNDDRPPKKPNPMAGEYRFCVFSKAEGNNIYSWAFQDPAIFPKSVPVETTDAGLIEKRENRYKVLDSVFEFDESGKVVKKNVSSQPTSQPDKQEQRHF